MADRSDDFNRADNASALGTPSDSGSDWVAQSGTWGIASNRARMASGSGYLSAILESAEADVEVEATLAVAGTDVGLVFRATDDSNYLVAYNYDPITLFRRESGTFTSLGTGAGGTLLGDGDVLKVEAIGDQVSLYRDGVLVLGPITVAFNQAATKHGLFAYHDATATRFDDFSIAPAGGGAPAPAGLHHYTRLLDGGR